MSFSMFLHISLNIPNRWGFPQLAFDLVDNKPVLFYLLNSLSLSSRLKDIYLICSDKAVDDPIFLLSEQFKKSRIRVHCLRLQSGLEYSFESANLAINCNRPPNFKEILGLYNLKFFLELHRTLNFSNIIIAWADSIPLLNGLKLDDIIEQFDGGYLSLGAKNGNTPFLLASYREVNQAYQELRSERTQDLELKTSTLNKRGSSAQKKQAFEYFKNLPISILATGEKIKSTKKVILKEVFSNKDFNPFFALKDREDLTILERILPVLYDLYDSFSTGEWLLENSFLNKKKDIFKKLDNICTRSTCNEINCHHLILDISSEKKNMEMFDTRDMDNLLSKLTDLRIMTFEERFEELKNPNLPELIKTVSKKISYIELKTFVSEIDNTYLIKLFQKGLKAIRLNLDKITIEASLFRLIDNLLSLRETVNSGKRWYLFLEITFKSGRDKLIASLFHKYEYLVDKIVVLPHVIKDTNVIDFSPLKESLICRWTVNTLYITSDLKCNLCENSNHLQYDLTFEDARKLQLDRGNMDICNSCFFKQRVNGYALEQDSNPWIKDKDKTFIVLMSLFQEYVFLFLSGISSEDLIGAYKVVISMDECFYEERKKNILLQFANKLISFKQFSHAVDIIEIILKTDPTFKEAHKILDKLCVQLN